MVIHENMWLRPAPLVNIALFHFCFSEPLVNITLFYFCFSAPLVNIALFHICFYNGFRHRLVCYMPPVLNNNVVQKNSERGQYMHLIKAKMQKD